MMGDLKELSVYLSQQRNALTGESGEDVQNTQEIDYNTLMTWVKSQALQPGSGAQAVVKMGQAQTQLSANYLNPCRGFKKSTLTGTDKQQIFWADTVGEELVVESFDVTNSDVASRTLSSIELVTRLTDGGNPVANSVLKGLATTIGASEKQGYTDLFAIAPPEIRISNLRGLRFNWQVAPTVSYITSINVRGIAARNCDIESQQA